MSIEFTEYMDAVLASMQSDIKLNHLFEIAFKDLDEFKLKQPQIEKIITENYFKGPKSPCTYEFYSTMSKACPEYDVVLKFANASKKAANSKFHRLVESHGDPDMIADRKAAKKLQRILSTQRRAEQLRLRNNYENAFLTKTTPLIQNAQPTPSTTQNDKPIQRPITTEYHSSPTSVPPDSNEIRIKSEPVTEKNSLITFEVPSDIADECRRTFNFIVKDKKRLRMFINDFQIEDN